MASSSSANKVARVAARSGGGSKTNKQANWLFPAAIVVIVALGVAVVAFARSENAGTGDNDVPPRAQLSEGSAYDHWHAAFAVNVCGKEQPVPNDVKADLLGIHTHGDGLIHIHPFSLRAAGKRATLARFFDQVGITATDDGFSDSSGQVYKAGETECAGEATEVVMAHWKDATKATSTAPDQIFRKDFGSVLLSEDGGAYTLALVPVGSEDIAAPAAAAEIEELGAVDGGSTSSDAPQQGTDVPVTEAGGTDTTTGVTTEPTVDVSGDSTATTVAGSDATTTPASTAPASTEAAG